jgi:hypothetical protein
LAAGGLAAGCKASVLVEAAAVLGSACMAGLGAVPDSKTPARIKPYEVPTKASAAAAPWAMSPRQGLERLLAAGPRSSATEVAVSTR